MSELETATKGTDVTTVHDVVEVRLPASGAYLSVLRTATAGLAARLDFTLDDIEDLRIAVDEACAMLLPDAQPGTELFCRFHLTGGAMTIVVSLLTVNSRLPEKDSFSWTVLTALAGEVDASVDGHLVSISLRKRRESLDMP